MTYTLDALIERIIYRISSIDIEALPQEITPKNPIIEEKFTKEELFSLLENLKRYKKTGKIYGAQSTQNSKEGKNSEDDLVKLFLEVEKDIYHYIGENGGDVNPKDIALIELLSKYTYMFSDDPTDVDLEFRIVYSKSNYLGLNEALNEINKYSDALRERLNKFEDYEDRMFLKGYILNLNKRKVDMIVDKIEEDGDKRSNPIEELIEIENFNKDLPLLLEASKSLDWNFKYLTKINDEEIPYYLNEISEENDLLNRLKGVTDFYDYDISELNFSIKNSIDRVISQIDENKYRFGREQRIFSEKIISELQLGQMEFVDLSERYKLIRSIWNHYNAYFSVIKKYSEIDLKAFSETPDFFRDSDEILFRILTDGELFGIKEFTDRFSDSIRKFDNKMRDGFEEKVMFLRKGYTDLVYFKEALYNMRIAKLN